MLGAHYRTALNYTQEALDAAATALNSIYDFVRRNRRGSRGPAAPDAAGGHPPLTEDWLREAQAQFQTAIDDDLNMPRALATVHDLIREANRRGRKPRPSHCCSTGIACWAYNWPRKLNAQILSQPISPVCWPAAGARAAKDWSRADTLRDQIKAAGYELEDTPQGVRWKRGEATGLVPR